MKINYILSDTTKNATTLILKEVVKTAESDLFQNNIVIVPETKSIIIEKELLASSKTGAFGNVFVYSFVRLLDRLGCVSRDKIVSKQALVILIRKIIYENIDKLVCYKKTAKSVGFAEKIYDTIAQFKSSGVTPEDLKLTLLTKSEALKSKLSDIIFLYEKYEESLKGELYDDCDKLALISSFSKTSEFIKNSNVFVVGFDNITFEMQTVLENLAKNCKMIAFSCVYFDDSKSNKHIQPNELYNKFKYISNTLNYPYVPKRQNIRASHDIEIIKNNLFSTKKVTAKSNGGLKIFKASSEKVEIDYVANTILLEVKNGKRFKDIGVLVCGIEDRLEQIKDCFNAYKIPFFANVPQKIDNHFLIKFLSSAFDLYSNHLSSENVLAFVSNPLFGAKNYDYFESYVNEVGINYKDFLNDVDEDFIKRELKNISFSTGKSNDEDEDEDNEIEEIAESKIDEVDIDEKLKNYKFQNIADLKSDLKKFKEFYLKFEEILKKSSKASEYIEAILFILKEFNVRKKIDIIGDYQKENGLVIDGETTKAVLSKLDLFNGQILNFLGDSVLSTNEFIQIYKSGYSTCKINLSPVSIDAVIVQDNTDGFYDIKDLFIIGAVEGKFPAKLQDSGIILDSELEEAKSKMGKTIEPAVKDINRREKYKAYESLLEPKEKLFVSFYEKEQSGKIARSSQIVNNLVAMFGEGIVSSSYDKLRFVNYEIFENEFVSRINKYLNDEEDFKNVNDAKNILGDNISEPLKRYLDSLTFSKGDFTLGGISDLYFSFDKTSISQLQTYFTCPYKFFAYYGLRLKENKLAKIMIPDIGTIIHRVVELFIKDLKNYEKLDDGELNLEIRKLAQKAMEENYFTIDNNKSLMNLIFDECERLCKYVIFEQSVSSFKFDRAEYCFDGENAINLSLKSDRKIKISGKIDRIDKFGDYVRVIDYKTGQIENSLRSIYYGKKIQLAIYIEAISGGDKPKVAGIFYFPIHSDFSMDEKSSKRAYRMEGLILDNADVVKYMDSELSPEHKSSDIVPLSVTFDKNGQMQVSSRQKKYSETDFEEIKNYVNKLCSVAVDEILSGNIEPSPMTEKGNDGQVPTACKYCELSGFCKLKNAKFKYGRRCDKKVDNSSFYLSKENEDEK